VERAVTGDASVVDQHLDWPRSASTWATPTWQAAKSEMSHL
jgi:hypothetical protein